MLLADLDQRKSMRLQSQRQRVVLEALLRRGWKGSRFAERLDLRQRGKRWMAHLFPGRERRAMFFVHDGQANGVSAPESLEMERESFWGACFLRQEKIPGRDDKRAIFAARHEHAIGVGFEARIAKVVEKREIVECGFGDAAFGEQAESAVERRLHHALLFKNIRESPVAHHCG